MIILVDDFALTDPSVFENEKTFLVSVANWNDVGRLLSFTMLSSLLVLFPI